MTVENAPEQSASATGGSTIVQPQSVSSVMEGFSIFSQNGTTEGGEAKTFAALVPEDYQDRSYLSDFLELTPEEGQIELLKKMDGMNTLIGRKTISNIPDVSKASDSDMEKFHFSTRPEKAESYDIVLGLPEGQQATPEQQAFATDVQKMFHDAGLSTWQAKKLSAQFNEVTAKYAPKPPSEEEWSQLSKDTFGSDEQAATAFKNSKELLQKYVPQNMKAHVEGLDNHSLMVLASVLNGVYNDFMVEDNIRGMGGKGGAGAGAGGESKAELQARLSKLQALPEYNNQMSPKYTALRTEAREIAVKMSKLA